MTAPAAPTKTTICTEALKRFFNGGTPESAEITRAEDYGLEKVKRDIMNLGKKWKPLLRTVYDITKVGVGLYANPSDFEANCDVALMSGDHSGVLGTVVSTSIVDLAGSEDITKAEAEGKWLLITSGTGADQAQMIDDYNTTSKRASMVSAFDTLCVTADGYLIVNDIKNLREIPLSLYDRYEFPGIAGPPTKYSNVPNQTVGELALYPIPDAVYGLRRRYYADLMLMDLSSTLYSTILRRWAGVFEQGVYVWKLGEDDDRFATESQTYQGMLVALMAQDLSGFDMSKIQKGA